MYMPMSLLFKNNNNEKTHMYSQHILLALLWPRKEETVKKKCYKGKQNKKTNVQAVILTCVSRGLETVCSVFMSVSVSVCVCVYVCCAPFSMVAILECYEICDSRECENMSVLQQMW